MTFARFIVKTMDGDSDFYEDYDTYEHAETIGEKCVELGKAAGYFIQEIENT